MEYPKKIMSTPELIQIRKDQKEAVDEVADFLSTLNEKEISTFRAVIQGAKITSDIYRPN